MTTITKAEAQKRLDTALAGNHLSGLIPLCRELIAALPSGEAVAIVKSWTNGSYKRNYQIEWHSEVESGTKLYAGAPPTQTGPVAWGVFSNDGACLYSNADRDRAQDKADWTDKGWQASGPFTVNPLYAGAPPAASPCPHLRSGDSGSQYCVHTGVPPDSEPYPEQDAITWGEISRAREIMDKHKAGAVPDVKPFAKLHADGYWTWQDGASPEVRYASEMQGKSYLVYAAPAPGEKT